MNYFKTPDWVKELGYRLLVGATVAGAVLIALFMVAVILFGVVYPIAVASMDGTLLGLLHFLWTVPATVTAIVFGGMYFEWAEDTFW